ncbi:hypothetical protein [Bradyrhizobium sp.]|uniref:hypothetical protein n=1 Tax=Bradyrhizobium sp. TaxID=376 RepID=UPI0025C0A556|nr:hypothetical protein [Bradyrhizobium sp.]MCA3254804.1 hypothetical protein [Alphaproteobacteria bacterium]MCA3566274.1 hypothetical protein [Bradyrhizobium sp.]
MSAQHTPGPWEFLDIGEIVAGEDGEVTIAIMNDGTDAAHCSVVEANGNLIAAAPEVLAALHLALDALDADPGNAPVDDTQVRLVQAWLRAKFGDAARAAIAKAEGR